MSAVANTAAHRPAFDSVAADLEQILGARFPDLLGRSRVVVRADGAGVAVCLHTIGVPEADAAQARLFLAALTGAVQVPAEVAWFDPRRGARPRTARARTTPAEVVHLADHRRAG